MNKQSSIKTEVDTNLYSRQIGTFGMETMGKLIQMKVLIYGMRGLGVEIAKNIILAGPRQVSIFDDTIARINDLGSNFYLTEKHVGSTRRDEASVEKLRELNPYVHVDILRDPLEQSVLHYNCVVITEVMNRDFLERLDERCREANVGFIYAAALGPAGFAFVDFGKNHMIRDADGEECKNYIIRAISKDERGIVLIDDTIGAGKLALTDGDYVTFKEVGGMNELNDGQPREIKYVSPIAFSIGDTSQFGDHTGGGIVEQVKVPKHHLYKSLRESFESPYNGNAVPDPIDFSKFGRNELLHCGVLALHEFYNRHGCLPELNNENHTLEVVDIAKKFFEEGSKVEASFYKNSQEFSDKVISNLAKWSRAQLAPVTAFLGGVIAQEIVKLTGKYTPLNQWLWFDFYETTENLESPNRTLLNSRYDEQIAVYGQEMLQKIQNANIFMIGAGALGCEFLKEFALMGVATEGGKLVVTDNDNIEISNLNRQFLFRKDDVGQPKSQTACRVAKHINTKLNVSSLQSRVGPENEHIFDDCFWKNQTFVINAVDNIHARKYIDSMCTWYGRPLIDSGTLGTKAHVQMVVPNVTSCYNDTQDPPEESIPMCTLHNFPAMIEHCIEWGRDHFSGQFTDVVRDAQKLIVDPNGLYNDLKKEGNITFQLEKLTTIKKIIEISISKDFNRCIEFAIERYTENFDYKIKQLLFNFPADYTNPDGSKFWSGSKRVPSPIVYDANDKTCLEYVATYSLILARALSINSRDIHYIQDYSSKVNVPEFVPKKIKIKVNDNEPDTNVEEIGKEEEAQLSKLMNELSVYDSTLADPSNFKAEDFEKDDDSNNHIDFIHSTSNLRARNYRIKEADRQKTKMIAGKIIPAIATTTAAITGLVALQIYTLFTTNNITYMRNAFMNLAVNLFVLTEPAEKIPIKDKDYDPMLLGPVRAIPPNWTVWDKIVINGPMTFRQFIDYMNSNYKVDVSIITTNKITLIQTFQPSNKARLDTKIEVQYNQLSKVPLRENQNYLVLEVSADTEDGSTALLPLIQYNFK